MLNLKRWEPITYYLDAERKHPITFQVKRLKFVEAEPYQLILAGTLAAIEPTMRFQQAVEDARDAAASAARDAGADEEAARRAGDAAADVESAKKDPQTIVDAMRETYKAFPPDQIVAAFRDCVREVSGLAVDGIEITTGDQLYEIADEKLVIFVIGSIRRYARLSVTEGKDSSSSQTSTSTATASSSSPAAITSDAVGAEPSVAAAPRELESSIAGA